jgi:hypothetical protein
MAFGDVVTLIQQVSCVYLVYAVVTNWKSIAEAVGQLTGASSPPRAAAGPAGLRGGGLRLSAPRTTSSNSAASTTAANASNAQQSAAKSKPSGSGGSDGAQPPAPGAPQDPAAAQEEEVNHVGVIEAHAGHPGPLVGRQIARVTARLHALASEPAGRPRLQEDLMRQLLAKAEEHRKEMGDKKVTFDHMVLAMGEDQRCARAQAPCPQHASHAQAGSPRPRTRAPAPWPGCPRRPRPGLAAPAGSRRS